MASLDPVESAVRNKRKKPLALEKEELSKRSPKRLRLTEPDSLGAEHCAENTGSDDQHATSKTDAKTLNGHQRGFDCPEATGLDLSQDEAAPEPEGACTGSVAPPPWSASDRRLRSSSEASLIADVNEPALSPHCGALCVSDAEEDFTQEKSLPEELKRQCSPASSQSILPQFNEWTARIDQKSLNADITSCKDIRSGTEELEELISVPTELFWRNTDNLCWLDSLLVALVNCKSLRKCKPKDEPQQSSVWQLMRGYEEVCAAIQVHRQTGRDGIARVPKHVLQKASADLQNLRMSVFRLLQPKLHCKLGQRETPVFAMPLLVAMDSWVEPLFQSTFQWEFRCSQCKTVTKERVVKTLPTFTNIVPGWHPLHAVHLAPCNACGRKNQRRTMLLEGVPPVFVLHFVEGLPDSNVRIYAFSFKGKRYSVSTVIQYNCQLKHFVTWIRNSDGSWLEYDDLKHPDCKTHQKLPVPPQELHVVFWEMEEAEQPRVCSLSSTFSDSPPSKNETNSSLGDKDLTTDTPDQSLLTLHNDTDIVCAYSVTEDNSNITDTTVTADIDTSIGSTTLLDAFEGLSHSDIVTLTLVELKADSEMQPSHDGEETKNLSTPSKNEVPDLTPDSSSTLIGSIMCQGSDVEHPTSSNSSESEPGDDSSSDPTYVPGARIRQGRGTEKGKTISRQKGKMAILSKAAPYITPPASSEPSKVIKDEPVRAAAQGNTSPVEATQKTSFVSSTETPPLSTSQKNPTKPPALDQNAHWSFLVSKHPIKKVHTPVANLTHMPTSVTVTPPTHSLPNPVRRQHVPEGVFLKPQLRTEESVGLPLKAAEMYTAFGAESSSTPSPLPAPSLTSLSGKSKQFQPITSHHQKSLMSTTVVSSTSLPVPGAKGLPEISSPMKHSSHSSKVPPGLSETAALRYKLMKKLKAKKKQLAKLNKLLNHQGGTSLRPDSTDLSSPQTVSSSTYNGSTCDDFLSDLLSPATTVSNLSPDSTGLLEMLTNGQDGGDQFDCGVSAVDAVSQANTCINDFNTENFLDEFLSQAAGERPTEMETEALSALELFI